ncbi:hypothetical protein [Paenibacillus sp. N3.4]|nr:hypothetical protein [Paenibacillus sp. N3.4]
MEQTLTSRLAAAVWAGSFARKSWTGTLKDKVVSLIVPSNDGKLNTIQF